MDGFILSPLDDYRLDIYPFVTHALLPSRIISVTLKMFPTAEAAETHFYEAFSNSDTEQMMAVWAEIPEISCIHPGGSLLEGAYQIRSSWNKILRPTTRRIFKLRTLMRHESSGFYLSLVEENISLDGRFPAGPPIYATNFYRCFDNKWLMILHHASAAPFIEIARDAVLDGGNENGSREIH